MSRCADGRAETVGKRLGRIRVAAKRRREPPARIGERPDHDDGVEGGKESSASTSVLGGTSRCVRRKVHGRGRPRRILFALRELTASDQHRNPALVPRVDHMLLPMICGRPPDGAEPPAATDVNDRAPFVKCSRRGDGICAATACRALIWRRKLRADQKKVARQAVARRPRPCVKSITHQYWSISNCLVVNGHNNCPRGEFSTYGYIDPFEHKIVLFAVRKLFRLPRVFPEPYCLFMGYLLVPRQDASEGQYRRPRCSSDLD